MSHIVSLGKRDLALFGFLEMTPATAAQIRRASEAFGEEPFRDERRVRERLQALGAAGHVRSFRAAADSGGVQHYYRLAPEGYRALHPEAVASPARTLVNEVAPSRLRHTLITADVIAHTLVACHVAGVRLVKFHGDGRLDLTVGEYRAQPDCHFQLEQAGKLFNVVFEIDNATEPLDSPREQSIKSKLFGYEAYQDWVLGQWKRQPGTEPRPGFRVVFLTRGVERAYHILWMARHCARNPDRRLVYAATQDAYLAEPLAVTQPIINDHHGRWQSLVNLHPSSGFVRNPVRLSPPLAPRRTV